MKIVFRLNYQTVPGQSLWIKCAGCFHEDGVFSERILPLQWINNEQWETNINVTGKYQLELKYYYQLRQADEFELDEWHIPRNARIDMMAYDSVLMLDTWCSAGTVDFAFETNAFLALLPTHRSFKNLATPKNSNHAFQLRMSAVPPGKVPCLIGSVSEIGGWNWHSAVHLIETSANVWQVHLFLPEDQVLEYKYGLFDLKLNGVTSLEQGENRRIPVRSLSPRQWTKVEDECYRRDDASLFRGAGVAMPVFSLRSEKSLGVGEFADLKRFGDWAHRVGFKLIQILPINDTTSAHDWTDSYPYSAISVFALHPIYLRIDDLKYATPTKFKKQIEIAKIELNLLDQVDYEAVMRVKLNFTRQIYDQHRNAIIRADEFNVFLERHAEWVIPYAVFCVKRDYYGSADFNGWGEWKTFKQDQVNELIDPKHPEYSDVIYHIWLQYELDIQLADAARHLHETGVALKGDLPIGIDRESVDAWSAPQLFKMDAQAGAPPDAFAVKGQNWGFPTYNWDVMRQDDFAWWRSRFTQLSRYFDAYRIDHILGFFRIWQIPIDHVEGIMGQFDPALAIHIDEIHSRGIGFEFNRFCCPYLREDCLLERFGESLDRVKLHFLNASGHGFFQLRNHVATQRQIVDYLTNHPEDEFLRVGLLDCAGEVLFFEVDGSGGTLFHPRCSMQSTKSYQGLDDEEQQRMDDLYNDYFYTRQEAFWQAGGYEKLPAMRKASSMLLCGEDLGMVPACVPDVLKQLGILSLEIQRMPKTHEVEFFDPRHAAYLSVVSPSTHDMPTLRAWWRENSAVTDRFALSCLSIASPDVDLSGEVASQIIRQHLESPAMWAIFPLQDILAVDETLRHPDPEAERINVPAIMPFYWRYRLHLDLEELADADDFNRKLKHMILAAGR